MQINLHQHTEGSALDGQATVENVFKRGAELGMEFVTITDHGECNRHLAGFKEAQKTGVRFIPGMEGYWMDFSKFSTLREEKIRPSPSHICLLAMTDEGLRNLWTLSSKAYTDEHFYYKPVSTPEHFKEHSSGIWASDGCMLTEFADAIEDGKEDVARAQLGTLLDCFGDRFYMELHTWQYMDDANPEHKALNERMTRLNLAKVRFANELGVPLVVVNDSHHAYPEHWINKELVWALSTGKKDADKLQAKLDSMGQKADHLMDDDEVRFWMTQHGISGAVIDEAIKNSYDIASNLEITGVGKTLSMPAMAESESEDLKNLIEACEAGFKQFVTDEGLDEAKYYARLEEELTLIADKKFSGYFNMVRDYGLAYRSGAWSQYVKKGADRDPMLVGPARGSAGGSLVAYLTGITIIDPIKYGTLFSRFLSPGRKGLPDVDMDVPQSRRPDALKYFGARFGEENVCLIGTLVRNGPKQMIKDLGRALGINKMPNGYQDLEKINQHIEEVVQWHKAMSADDLDAAEDLTWGDVIEKKGGALATYAKKYPELFERVGQMVGMIRGFSVHPAGVVVSSTPLMGASPMRLMGDKRITTQLDMWEIEELGGVKLDLLGIRHLDTLSVARQMIYERHGVWIDYDRTGLSVPAGCTDVLKFGDDQFKDPSIWDAIDKGHTTGIFQVETPNCTQAAMEFRPRSEVDIADLTSIIRPGVADAGLKEPYLRRRAGTEPVTYEHPLMTTFVGPEWVTNTHGIMVYQEQLMLASVEMAGFTADEADTLRSAVGKKQMDKLLTLKQKFMDGCLANPEFTRWFARNDDPEGQARGIVEHIWSSIEASGRYAFNWSHAVGYAIISTWEIWTKHHYPQEFLVALMQTDNAKGSINKYIREARRWGVEILPPDINTSARKFTIEGNAIRYGLDSIRQVGAAATRDILKVRPFTDLSNFLEKAGDGADLGVVTNLIKIGAFDSFGTRAEMIDQLEDHRCRKDLAESTLNDPEKLERVLANRRANPNYQLPRWDFDSREVIYEIEKELVGTYVTVDPMARYFSALDGLTINDPTDMRNYARGQKFVIGGQITAVKPTVTKNGRNPGQAMGHITVTWNEADFRIVVFPQVWAAVHLLLTEDKPVACEVKKLDDGCCLESIERLDVLYDREGIA